MSPSWICSDKITNERVTRVGYNHFISNSGSWNNCYVITSAEVIIAGGQIFKIAVSRFVNVSEEEINLMKENAIPRNTKQATKFGMTLFKGKM